MIHVDKVMIIIFIVILVICIAFSYAFYNKNLDLELFSESCYNADGVVLTNAIGSGKYKTYSHICINPEMIIDIK